MYTGDIWDVLIRLQNGPEYIAHLALIDYAAVTLILCKGLKLLLGNRIVNSKFILNAAQG